MLVTPPRSSAQSSFTRPNLDTDGLRCFVLSIGVQIAGILPVKLKLLVPRCCNGGRATKQRSGPQQGVSFKLLNAALGHTKLDSNFRVGLHDQRAERRRFGIAAELARAKLAVLVLTFQRHFEIVVGALVARVLKRCRRVSNVIVPRHSGEVFFLHSTVFVNS
jgi:hypothetical protein